MFLNKTLPFFPNWLNLILTSKRCNEKLHLKKHLTNIKYEKLSMDRCVNVNTLLNTSNQLMFKKILANKSSNESHLTSLFGNSSAAESISTATPIQTSLSSHSLRNETRLPTSVTTNFQQQQQPCLSTPVELCNAAHFANLKDIQAYILKRLDTDSVLKKKFNKANAIEMINLLLIKSNFCLLYVERILDLILGDFIDSNEIKCIPATLSGFYLYLLQRILANHKSTAVTHGGDQLSTKDVLYAILSLGLIEPSFDKTHMYTKLTARFRHLSFDLFEGLFNFIEPLLLSKVNDKFCLNHASLIDWLTDVKFCTPSYLVSLNEAHLTMSLHYFNRLQALKESKKLDSALIALNFKKFKFHLLNSAKTASDSNLDYLYSLCQPGDVATEVCEAPNYENLNALVISNIKTSNTLDDVQYERVFFELIGRNDLPLIKLMVEPEPRLAKVLNQMVDSFGQNALLVSVKLNNVEMAEYLLRIGHADVNLCDSSGWTPLRYSAWMGNADMVKLLLKNNADVDAADNEGRTALRAACFSGHQHIVELLLKHEADSK